MQKNQMAEKARAIFDGDEIPGLVMVAPIEPEYKTVAVPQMLKEHTISSGTKVIPTFEMEYINDRSTKTRKFLQDFFNNKEKKELNLIRTDGDGSEYMNEIYTNCECIKYSKPSPSARDPELSVYKITVAPDDILELET